MYKVIYFFILIILTACASETSNISQVNTGNETKYFVTLAFDKYGVPCFRNEIDKSKIPDYPHYILVNFLNNKYDNAYLIKQEKLETDMTKPFKVIYTWTGKGFNVGYESSKGIIEYSSDLATSFPINNPPLAIITAVPGYIIGTTIFVASSATGFIIGLGKSVPEAYNEIKNIGKINGVILGKYLFEYDSTDRITKYSHYSPSPENNKLSDTFFYYYKNANTPYKSINDNLVDKKKRIIYQQ